jgi:DNA integrity scanning protein DisA with diadenylate cyclase activity
MKVSGEEQKISQSILKKAFELGEEINAKALFISAELCPDAESIEEKKEVFDVYLVAKSRKRVKEAGKIVHKVLLVPDIPLTRMGQIKIAIMMAVSQNLLEKGDRVVCLSGIPRFGSIDTLVVFEVGKEVEMLSSDKIINFTKEIDPTVFEEIVRIATQIAAEGREGKPVGTAFVIDPTGELKKRIKQMVLNPFKGYEESERNILSHRLKETIKEFAQLDGAFIVRGDGVVETAGAFIKADIVPEELPQGWGARHVSSAAITYKTKAVAVTVSQSTGDVRIFKGGYPIMEIEKPVKT